MKNGTRVRELGSIENLFAAYGEAGAMTFAVFAKVRGELTLERLQEAVRQVRLRHPILSLCIGQEAGRRRIFELSTRGPDIEVHDEGNWTGLAEDMIAKSFDTTNGALFRVGALRQGNRFYLGAAFHHSIADGMSATFVVRDIVHALAGRTLPVAGAANSLDAWLGEAEIAMKAKELGSVAGAETTGDNPWATNPSANACVRTLALEPSLTARIETTARDKGTTVHAALSVAIVRALLDEPHGRTGVRLMSPINMRNTFSSSEHCGMFISAGIIAHVREGLPFWEEAILAQANLLPHRTKEAALGFASLCRAKVPADATPDDAVNFMWHFCTYDAMLTNLGRLEIDGRCKDYAIEEIWGPVLRCCVEGEDVIGAATYDGHLRLVHTSLRTSSSLLEDVRTILEGV
ncbi:condensation domain-containing protein [Rhizobium sp. GCM10022189]|uniref:condensation domain-containing protein n=1 Tax=Rhizobium sp. GCM10022189 TaxID=3252654 RepID=UPI0036194CAE